MCYHTGEVNRMDTENRTPEQPSYTPRPRWQVWAARIGLVLFIGIVIAQILQLAGIGL